MIILSIPNAVIEKLESLNIQYQTIELPEDMNIRATAKFLEKSSKNLIRIVGLSASSRLVVAALPFSSLLDFKLISEEMQSEFEVMSIENTQKIFKGCKDKSFPPVPDLFECRLVIDTSLLDLTEVIVQSGDPSLLIKMDKINANLLFQECESITFSPAKERFYAGRGSEQSDAHFDKSDLKSGVDLSFTQIRLKQRIDETFDLPAMPEIAQDIMKLRVDPSADATKLSKIVSRDPSLATQVISWASSPYYGYQGKVDSVETAIARVLGFELVMNLALGISIGKSLKVPMDGPLGVREFWKQSIYTANLAEKLCRAMPITQRPERGLIYLSGLLHNFGHLLLGHIFPPQFKLVNQTIEANPHIAVEDIEFYILGVTHEEIGAWLMKNWHMPDELIVAVERHHQQEFWSKHSVYSNIVLVANRLLKRLNIGDAIETEIPTTTLELLSLEESMLDSAIEDIRAEAETLDIMAKQLVA